MKVLALVLIGILAFSGLAVAETLVTSNEWHGKKTLNIADTQTKVEGYLGAEYLHTKNLAFGVKAFLDLNGGDLKDWADNDRYEFGCVWKFGPGL